MTPRPFNSASYVSILSEARGLGYNIRPMQDAFTPIQGTVLLLRHDVDLSLEHALEMAELEFEHGVRSTYFILPHNEFYSPFSLEGRAALNRLIHLGHEIGLHWDSSVYPVEGQAFRNAVRRDLDALAEITGSAIRSASQHVPIDTRFVDLSDLIEIESYSPQVRAKFSYVSDSAMAWRSHTPWSLLSERKNMQFLAHPIWWMGPGDTREEKLRNLAGREAKRSTARIEELLAYMNKCLLDRDRLDSRLVEQWNASPPDTAETPIR